MSHIKDSVLIQPHEDPINHTFIMESYLDEHNNSLGFIPYSMRPETYIVPILFAIIFIIGVMGNATLIGIFIKHRTMRNVPNMYIVSLAVGDLFVILFCVPFTSTVYTLESWPYGEFVCKFSEFIKDMSIGVSVFTLTALSADRYYAIVDPMRKLHGRRATRVTCLTIAGIWVLALLLALPSGLLSYVRIFDDEPTKIFYVCYPFPDFPDVPYYAQIMVMFHFLIYYAIPLLFIGTFYIIMAYQLLLSTKNLPGEAPGQMKQIQSRKKVAKMILAFVVIFALCFFPSHLFMLHFYFNADPENSYNDFWHACRIMGFCLSFINSCINPITLYCVSGTFRKQFNEHLFCCICNKEDGVRANRRAGFGCGCVSLSSAGPVFRDNRLRNSYTRGRSAASTNSNGFGTCKMKRKPTWDTQSTITSNQHHTHSLYNNQSHRVYRKVNVPSPTTTPTPSSGIEKHSLANIRSLSPQPIPYQKEYQEYLNRINDLENGVGVGNYTKTKLAETKFSNRCEEEVEEVEGNSGGDGGRKRLGSEENEVNVTNLINLRGSSSTTTTTITRNESYEVEVPTGKLYEEESKEEKCSLVVNPLKQEEQFGESLGEIEQSQPLGLFIEEGAIRSYKNVELY